MVAGEQIDEVEIRRMGQRPAPEPAQREDDKLAVRNAAMRRHEFGDRRSEEHTSELQSLMRISYAVFCLKKKTNHTKNTKYNKTKQNNTNKKQRVRTHKSKE